MSSGSDGPVLVLRLSALGDVIHTLPAVRSLRAALPARRIAWVVEAPYRELVEHAAGVDRVFAVRTRRWREQPLEGRTRSDLVRLWRELREFSRGGIAVDFQGLYKSAILARASGAKIRYGFSREAIRERGAMWFVNRHIPVDRSRHVVEWNLQLASAVAALDAGSRDGSERTGEDVSATQFALGSFAADPDGSLAELVATPPLVLVPGAGRSNKQWGSSRFSEAGRAVFESRGTPVVVVWGPGERNLACSVVDATPGAILAPQTGLRELAFLLRHACLVVAGDTGPLHLADALGTAVVGLFGPTDPSRNGPYHQPDRVVESWTTTKEMSSIEVSVVVRTILGVMGREQMPEEKDSDRGHITE